MGITLHQRGKIKAAIRCYRHAINQVNPPYKLISKHLFQDLLLNGELEEGGYFTKKDY